LHEENAPEVETGHNILVGENVTILQYPQIGAGSIIGPTLVVRGVIPEKAFRMDNSVKVIGHPRLLKPR